MKNRLLKSLTDFIFPPVCHVCGERLTGSEQFICPGCLLNLPRTLYDRMSPNPMELRFAGLFPFERAGAAFFYSRQSAMSQLVRDFKYNDYPSLAVYLGRIAAEELFDTGFFNDIDMIVPVPMFIFKKISRGYNQTERIAQGVAQATGLPVCKTLRAVRSHKTQTALSREQRLLNLKKVFKADTHKELTGKHLLLVDDICTTGSTITQAAVALTSAADIRLSIFTLATTF